LKVEHLIESNLEQAMENFRKEKIIPDVLTYLSERIKEVIFKNLT
jgi:hypothetical protein